MKFGIIIISHASKRICQLSLRDIILGDWNAPIPIFRKYGRWAFHRAAMVRFFIPPAAGFRMTATFPCHSGAKRQRSEESLAL